jgi:HEAT repeat protein
MPTHGLRWKTRKFEGSRQHVHVRCCSRIGNGRTAETLDDVAVRNGSPRVRASAYGALRKLRPHDQQDLLERALRDEHSFVRRAAEQSIDVTGDRP